MRESAVSAKLLLGYGLARNRRSPKRPSEPRPSGAHPEEAQWKENAKPPRFERLLRMCGILLVLIAEIEPSWADLLDGPLNSVERGRQLQTSYLLGSKILGLVSCV